MIVRNSRFFFVAFIMFVFCLMMFSPSHRLTVKLEHAERQADTRHTDSGGSGTKTTVCDRGSDVLSLPFNPPVLPVTPPRPQVQTSRCVCSSDYLPAAGNCPDVLWEKEPVEATRTRPEEDPEGRKEKLRVSWLSRCPSEQSVSDHMISGFHFYFFAAGTHSRSDWL